MYLKHVILESSIRLKFQVSGLTLLLIYYACTIAKESYSYLQIYRQNAANDKQNLINGQLHLNQICVKLCPDGELRISAHCSLIHRI